MISPRTLAASALALLAVSACRPREGERCLCAGECAGNLRCAADGAVLKSGQCVASVSNDLESGVCIDAANIDFEDEALTPPPKFDAGSWATSGQVPITTAGTEATTGVDDTTATSSSSSSGDGESSSSSTGSATETTGSSSSSSGSSGAAGTETL